MNRRKISHLLIVGLLLLQVSALGASPAWADEGPTGPIKSMGEVSPDSIFLHLSLGSFDPLLTAPQEMVAISNQRAGRSDDFSSLFNTPDQAQADGAYIVQFIGPVLDEWKLVLETLGVEIGPYLPDFAFIVRLDPAVSEKVTSLDFVRWVGAYEPAYRISPYAWDQPQRSFRILLLPWASAESASLSPALTSASPQAYAPDALLAELDQASLMQAAHLPGVLWIEPLYLNELQSSSPRGLQNDIAGTILNAGTAWAASLNGAGIKVGVADTGLDTGSVSTIHGDFTGRVTNFYSYPVQAAFYGGACNLAGGDNDGWADLSSGHGTHVSGSLAGSGSRSSGQYKGMAYNALLAFQAIEQWTDWPSGCAYPDGYYLTGIPANPGIMLTDAYNWGVRIHSNSWGTSAYKGYYDAQARYFDDVTSQHRDLLVVVAAGNEGTDANSNGYVDADSVISPSTAKNVLTIGASDNERGSGGFTGTWFGGWPSDFPANPTANDLTSDNRQELAAFSGRGPVDDGRIKPDLVAPGTNIISTRSSVAPGTGWGLLNTYYMYNGGTSMATPLAAGAAALVRDYYIDQVGVANPSAALVKATLINSAVDITGYGNTTQEAGQPIPNMHEGWGRIDIGAAVTTGLRKFTDNNTGLPTNGVLQYTYTVVPGKPFKVSLVWSDVEANVAASVTLVNDLDLEVVTPDGTTFYRGNVFAGGWSATGGTADRRNNVENVYIQAPAEGIWTVRVRGFVVPSGPQPFALVASGNVYNAAPPSITSVTPNKGVNNAALNGVLIDGNYLTPVTQVQLKLGAATINGTVTFSSQTQLIVNFNINGATPGLWDVFVSTPSGSATLNDGMAVLDATLPDLQITKTALSPVVDPGSPITFTVVVKNISTVNASSVEFIDMLPAGMTYDDISPSCITFSNPPGEFTCGIGSLAAGATKSYTVVTLVDPGAQGFLENVVTVSSAAADRWEADNTASAKVAAGGGVIYLPMFARNWPPVPGIPVLQAISNSDGDGAYTVSWTVPAGNPITGYDLEQNGVVILSGWQTNSYQVTGRPSGTYQYRVRAVNSYGASPWSAPQSVTVAIANPVMNPGFELGDNGNWTWFSSLGLSPISGPPGGITAHGGSWIAWLGGEYPEGVQDTNNYIQQSVTIPSGAQNLTYWYQMRTAELGGCSPVIDKVVVYFGANALRTHVFCAANNTTVWVQATVSVAAFGGQTALLKFHLTQDGEYTSSFFLDDIAIR